MLVVRKCPARGCLSALPLAAKSEAQLCRTQAAGGGAAAGNSKQKPKERPASASKAQEPKGEQTRTGHPVLLPREPREYGLVIVFTPTTRTCKRRSFSSAWLWLRVQINR